MGTSVAKEIRFYKNAQKLLKRGVRAPLVNGVIHCPEISLKAVKYKEIPGNDLRYRLSLGEIECMTNLPDYIAMLHRKGIFFGRSILAIFCHFRTLKRIG